MAQLEHENRELSDAIEKAKRGPITSLASAARESAQLLADTDLCAYTIWTGKLNAGRHVELHILPASDPAPEGCARGETVMPARENATP